MIVPYQANTGELVIIRGLVNLITYLTFHLVLFTYLFYQDVLLEYHLTVNLGNIPYLSYSSSRINT